jgi:excisionase family DNA binding protein
VSEKNNRMEVHVEGQANYLQGEGMEYERLLNVGQVARMLGLSAATVRKWVLTRYIPYRKMGKAVRFSMPEMREWMKSRCVEPLEGRQKTGANEINGGKK